MSIEQFAFVETQSLQESSDSAASQRMLDVIEKFRCMPGTSRSKLPANTQEALMEDFYRKIFEEFECKAEERKDREAMPMPSKKSMSKHEERQIAVQQRKQELVAEAPLMMTQSMKERSSSGNKQPIELKQHSFSIEFECTMPSFGFSTAAGNKVNISKKAMQKGRRMLEEQEPELTMPSKPVPIEPEKPEPMEVEPPAFSFGFQTGNNKKVAIKKENMDRAVSMLAVLDSPKKISPPKKQNPTKPKMMDVPKDLAINTARPVHRKSLLLDQPAQKESASVENLPPSCRKVHDSMLRDFQPVKLSTLEPKRTDMSDYKQPQLFPHNKASCLQLFCAVCKHSIGDSRIFRDHILAFLLKKHKHLTEEQFQPLYEITLFKLSRYQKYYPELVNKRLTPSNIIYEVERKHFAMVFQNKVPALLRVKNGTVDEGVCLNLLVMGVTYVEDRGIYFVQLTDGWFTLFAVVVDEPRRTSGRPSNHHLLARLIRQKKLYVGSKISIAGWRFYPVRNIIKSLDNALNGQAIELFYNSTNRLSSNARLGFSRRPFYRPLRNCIEAGGNIPLTEFIIVKKYDHVDEAHFYLRISDQHGDSYCMRVPGSEEVASFYKPKDCYQMRKIRFYGGRELEPSKESSIVQLKSKELLEVYEHTLQQQLISSHKELDEVGQYCDIIIKIPSSDRKDESNTMEVTTLSGEPLTLKGDSLVKVLKRSLGKTVLVQEVIAEDLQFGMTLKQSHLTRVRTAPSQPFYKALM